jgi:hypothetical protein
VPALLLALTEGERLGILGLVGICVTAGASVFGAFLSHRVRRENSDQHGESQRLLVNLADKVDDHGQKLDSVADRVESVAARVDHAHSRIDNHKPRRWFR